MQSVLGLWIPNGTQNGSLTKNTNHFLKNMKKQCPLKRQAAPKDIADTILWLLSSARLITGETILVDAGLHLGKPM
jgi:enoyl-[acyl-carrier-protein] reductase (NADH)